MANIKGGLSWRRFILLYNCLSSASVTVELIRHEQLKLQSGESQIDTDKQLDLFLRQQFKEE
jgi:hypothetical protein